MIDNQAATASGKAEATLVKTVLNRATTTKEHVRSSQSFGLARKESANATLAIVEKVAELRSFYWPEQRTGPRSRNVPQRPAGGVIPPIIR
jgi:hypothetical protein